MHAGSFYIGPENIGWSIVEKETGVYKSGLSNKNSITDLLNSKQLTFMMSDYIIFNDTIFNEISKIIIIRDIITWFSIKAPLVIAVFYKNKIKNPSDDVLASVSQAISWFND